MIKLPVIIEIKEFHQRLNLDIWHSHFFKLTKFISQSELICKLFELIYWNVSICEHFFFDVINVVNESWKCNELVETNFPFQFNFSYPLQVFLNMVNGQIN